jgi:hypothetical protein
LVVAGKLLDATEDDEGTSELEDEGTTELITEEDTALDNTA